MRSFVTHLVYFAIALCVSFLLVHDLDSAQESDISFRAPEPAIYFRSQPL
jgi:hypothetical protein